MIELTEEEYINKLDLCIASKNLGLLKKGLNLFDSYCFKEKHEDHFPSVLFEKIISLMTDVNFQQLPDTSAVILIFEREWGKLNEDEKAILLKTIENTYGKFTDDLTHFILAEILGEYFADNKSHAIIDFLSTTKNDNARAFIAMAYRKLYYNKKENLDTKSILNKLKKMLNDSSQSVRTEVEISINKLNSKK